MESGGASGRYQDLQREEERIISEENALYKPFEYKRVFFTPQSGRWKVDASFVEGYYKAASVLLEGIVRGTFLEGIEGIAAIFLSRHYLELALKYALFHSRWLQERAIDEPSRNSPDSEVEGVEPDHNLRCLWGVLLSELNKRAPDLQATGLDLRFVEKLVNEFHQIDKRSIRFRYPDRLAVASPPEPRPESLGINFGSLWEDLERAHDILQTLDGRLVDQYGFNQDWETELNSL